MRTTALIVVAGSKAAGTALAESAGGTVDQMLVHSGEIMYQAQAVPMWPGVAPPMVALAKTTFLMLGLGRLDRRPQPTLQVLCDFPGVAPGIASAGDGADTQTHRAQSGPCARCRPVCPEMSAAGSGLLPFALHEGLTGNRPLTRR